MGAQDLYKVLGVDKDASQQQLEDAYKQRQSSKVVPRAATASEFCRICWVLSTP